MKEEALKLADYLDVESSQAEYGYVVDDWKLFKDSAAMIRKLVEELDKQYKFGVDWGKDDKSVTVLKICEDGIAEVVFVDYEERHGIK